MFNGEMVIVSQWVQCVDECGESIFYDIVSVGMVDYEIIDDIIDWGLDIDGFVWQFNLSVGWLVLVWVGSVSIPMER